MTLLFLYNIVILIYISINNFLYLFFLFMSIKSIFDVKIRTKYSIKKQLAKSLVIPSISVLVPAYNEENTIVQNVFSLLSLNYPKYEVIIINDGSKDNTLKILINKFNLTKMSDKVIKNHVHSLKIRGVYQNFEYPNLLVIDKVNGGKEDALNAGINVANYPLIASIDADSLLDKDALNEIMQVYLENQEEIIAIGGNIRIANGCSIKNGFVSNIRLPKKYLPMCQVVEYMKAFIGGRIGWSSINALFIVSGAFGLFKKEFVIKVGGYKGGSPGEDMHVILKLHKYMLENKLKYKIAFCPEAVCWTQAPETLKVLAHQRQRWSRGNLKNVLVFKNLLFNTKYKLLGFLILPYNLFFEVLNPYFRLTGLVALASYFINDLNNWKIFLFFLLIDTFYDLILINGSMIAEELAFGNIYKPKDYAKVFLYSFLMGFGYRQINTLWTIIGHIQLLFNKNNWGDMKRHNWNEALVSNNKNLK